MKGFRDQLEAELPMNFEKKSARKMEKIWHKLCTRIGRKKIGKKKTTIVATPKVSEEAKK